MKNGRMGCRNKGVIQYSKIPDTPHFLEALAVSGRAYSGVFGPKRAMFQSHNANNHHECYSKTYIRRHFIRDEDNGYPDNQ